MPKFSQESFSRLSQCHIDLQVLFFEVIRTIDCVVITGYRNEEDQEKAYKDGKTKLHWPCSKHNQTPSMAVDVASYPIDWKKLDDFYYFGGFVMGVASQLKQQGKITHSLRYGGDWAGDNKVSNEKFVDALHFELID